jgi:hypothetical protein
MGEPEIFKTLENICDHFERIGFHAVVRFPKVSKPHPVHGYPTEVDDETQRLICVETPGREAYIEMRITVECLRYTVDGTLEDVLLRDLGEKLGQLFTEATEKRKLHACNCTP